MAGYRDQPSAEATRVSLRRTVLPIEGKPSDGWLALGTFALVSAGMAATGHRDVPVWYVLSIGAVIVMFSVLTLVRSRRTPTTLEVARDHLTLIQGNERLVLGYDELDLEKVSDRMIVLRHGETKHRLRTRHFPGGRSELLSTFALLRAAQHAHRKEQSQPPLQVRVDASADETPEDVAAAAGSGGRSEKTSA